MYFYEGRTVRGIGWMSWGMVLQLATSVLGSAMAIILVMTLGSFAFTSPAALTALAAVFALACGLLIVEIAVVVLYLIGFHGMYAGRREYGPEQDRNMERALVFVILAIVFVAVQAVSPFTIVLGGLANPASTTLTLGVVLVAVETASALMAGLALMTAVSVFADGGQKTRLLIGMILGALGAFAGTIISLIGAYVGGAQGSSLETLIASSLAGSGTSAISLFVFFLVYREVRRKLEMGVIAPAVPLFPPVWPYFFPPYPYPTAPAPAPPATPPSPPPKP